LGSIGIVAQERGKLHTSAADDVAFPHNSQSKPCTRPTTAYRTMFERTQTPTTSVYKGMECRCAGIATLHSRHWYNTWLCVGWMTCEWLTRYEERTIVMISRSVYALSLSRWCRSHCADDRKSVARCLDGAPHARKQNRNIMRRCKG
jgi:hypothetical protein